MNMYFIWHTLCIHRNRGQNSKLLMTEHVNAWDSKYWPSLKPHGKIARRQ